MAHFTQNLGLSGFRVVKERCQLIHLPLLPHLLHRGRDVGRVKVSLEVLLLLLHLFADVSILILPLVLAF